MEATPLPIFDTKENLAQECNFTHLPTIYNFTDITKAKNFLISYKDAAGTFNSYRREIEKLIHWCALINKKSLAELTGHDLENYISFCQSPPHDWINTTKPARFVIENSIRIPNSDWRPFTAHISKAKNKLGEKPDIKNFLLSRGTLREIFAILSSFFNYLLQEEYVKSNPVALIRQKSKFLQKQQSAPKIRRLSELQWQYVINCAHALAKTNPIKYERTLFIMSALYSMYLRISELAQNNRWTPMMNNFYKDHDGAWWFTTVGKGNKLRNIAVSDAMLNALKRYRQHLSLSLLPTTADTTVIFPKAKGKGAIKSVNFFRKLVQECFDKTYDKLIIDGFLEEAQNLQEATTHWLRHTGISDDVKVRPREHVRDDAGHSSSSITDKYIDVELRERHQSKKTKLFAEDH